MPCHLFDHPGMVSDIELVRVPASSLFQDHFSELLAFLHGLLGCRGGGVHLLPLVEALLLSLLVPLMFAANREATKK